MPSDPGSHSLWIDAARREAERCAANGGGGSSSASEAVDPPQRELVEALARALPGYDIEAPIGRGGQGLVLRGVHRATRRSVAIKVLREGALGNLQSRARFDREVKILGQLKHPNIVTILDSGSAAGHVFFIMDFIRGAPLIEFVREQRLDLRTILGLFAKLCDALSAAHLRGIIHRDLKPANIRVDPSGEPHVLDFGLAKVNADDELFGSSAHRTQTGQFIGSLLYAAPEQFRTTAGEVDLRADVYALGVMLFQALTGELPYDADGPIHEVVERILTADPPSASRLNPRVSADAAAIVRKCLHKDAEQRYQSAGELGRELRRCLNGEPIEARRDSGWYVLRQAMRRHRISFTIAGLAGLLVAALAVTTWLLYQHERVLRLNAQADAERTQSQMRVAVLSADFLNEDLLPGIWAEARAQGVAVRAVVDRAAEVIESRAAGDPLVAAALHEMTGNAYMELSEWAEATPHAQEALRLRRAALGDDAAPTLAAMNLLGRLYRRLGRYAEAEALFDELLTGAPGTLGEAHELTMKARSNLAQVYSEQGRHQEAYELNRRVLDARVAAFGPDHPDTLTSKNNEAYYAQSLGRSEVAAQGYADVYETRLRVLGPDHPDTLNAMHNLATTWSRLGRLADAEDLELRRLELVRRLWGEQHHDTMVSLAVLGDIFRRQQRYEEAEEALLAAADIQRTLTGPEHAHMASRIRDLAALYADAERLMEAEAAYQQALDISQRILGPEHTQTCNEMRNLGAFYLARGRSAEAEPLLLAAHAGLSRHLDPGHPYVTRAAALLEELYEERGDNRAALEWCERAKGAPSTVSRRAALPPAP